MSEPNNEERDPSAANPAAEGGAPTPETPDTSETLAAESLAKAEAALKAALAERDDLKDQLLRKVADFDNYRKRMMKEKDDARLFANTGLLEDLVEVLDNFERAIRSSESARDYDSFHSGIVMIEGQFASMLERKYNLRRVEALGKPFVPDAHEAIAMEPGAEGQDMVVVEEYQKGYQLHDRVLRTAKVKVGPAKAETPATENKE